MHTLFFPANSSKNEERSVSFSINNDTIDEETEGFIVVLYRDTNLTFIEVVFTPSRRTTLVRIFDDDGEQVAAKYLSDKEILCIVFFFGFVVNEVTYDEERNEGLQKIRYSPAPGNKTEISFNFSLILNPLQGNFEFGGKLVINYT